jgi:ribosomal protein RSM22 (predicted rRNA methylase)
VLRVPGLSADFEAALWRVAAARLPAAQLRPRVLGAAIVELSRRYTRDRGQLQAAADPDLLAARLLFFAASDAPKALVPLAELACGAAGPAARPQRVLDLGAGTGAMSLGLLAFLRAPGAPAEVEITAVDQDRAALELGAAAVAEVAPLLGPVRLRFAARLGDARREAELPAGPFDLVLAGSVLNELWPAEPDHLVRRAALAEALCRRLAPDGALVLVEPALREVARDLGWVRAEMLATGRSVFAPCPHEGPCPLLARERDWCHEARQVASPPRLAELGRLTGLRHAEVRFAYLTVRAGPGLAVARGAPWRVVSHPLPGKGKQVLDVCGAGRRVRLELLHRDRRPGNAAFDEAGRGDGLVVLPPPGPTAVVRLGPDARVERR